MNTLTSTTAIAVKRSCGPLLQHAIKPCYTVASISALNRSLHISVAHSSGLPLSHSGQVKPLARNPSSSSASSHHNDGVPAFLANELPSSTTVNQDDDDEMMSHVSPHAPTAPINPQQTPSSDASIENMHLQALLTKLSTNPNDKTTPQWSQKENAAALKSFTAHQLDKVKQLRKLSDRQWSALGLAASIERACRLYLLSTGGMERYASVMPQHLTESGIAAEQQQIDLLQQPAWRPEDLGRPLPNSPHACSVAMPLWRHVIGYEEGDDEVIRAMACGYPRFFIHPYVSRLFDACEQLFAQKDETCFAFPSLEVAQRCVTFLQSKVGFGVSARINAYGQHGVHSVTFKKNIRLPVRHFWQHFGDIISSRYADDIMQGKVESPCHDVKAVLRQRIAQHTNAHSDDIYLYPSGMSAISRCLQMVQALSPGVKSVQLGFPYLDALKIQTVFGPGNLFFPNGDESDLDELERRMQRDKFSAVLVEFPGNPLLFACDIVRLSKMCRRAGVPLIVDDTIGSFGNISSFPHCDLLTTSLTKWFSGAGDVMAGSIILNTQSPFYADFKKWQNIQHTDLLYGGDARVLERNSRDFATRIERINRTTLQLCDWLATQKTTIQQLWTPMQQGNAQRLKPVLKPNASGCGGLFSIVLRHPELTSAPFYDALRVSKGPSLGNNFTQACPYTMLAHYEELDWAESVGISRWLIRVSAGLEPAEELIKRFADALAAIEPIVAEADRKAAEASKVQRQDTKVRKSLPTSGKTAGATN